MTFRLTQEAADRPRRTLHACEIFHMNASTISAACTAAAADEIVIATVDGNLTLSGIYTCLRSNLVQHMSGLDGQGWSIVFAPGTTRSEIEDRCLGLARIAFRRWEALRRWDSRHS